MAVTERDAALAARDPERSRRREEMILEHLPLVRALARRYADRGEPLDDLVQVGTVGLIKAADRFDPALGNDFRSFAAPTILGEIRRHFRDRTWSMKVPRGLKDDYATVNAAVGRLSASLGRTPTVHEIAEECEATTERVLDALEAHSAYRPRSLSQPLRPGDDESAPDIATDEPGYGLAEDRSVVAEGLRALPPRERVILHLRFEKGLLQSEIAARVGISQMHVSRLITRSLETLRRIAEEGEH
jgi:RNA polymerase sigma-B factor